MSISALFKLVKDGKYGAIQGVYIPNVLQMVGVILFMRLGWILGHVGMFTMGSIITLSSLLILITSLSMTSIVSNMKMKGGGAYYLVSRSLGVEFGSAIGVLQCITQLCCIALCVSGFAQSITDMIPGLSAPLIKAATLTLLALISYFSTDLAMKTQTAIFLLLAMGISAIFWGFSGIPGSLPMIPTAPSMTFWIAFSMFFPAITGIESGMSMSGDLRNPARSLPIGTIASVLTVFILYFTVARFLSTHVSGDYLRAYPFIFYYTNLFTPLILVGLWAASLSSAMGAILAGPRVMQAIAKDKILPSFLAKGHGPTNAPRAGTFFTFVLAMILTAFTNIDQIIPIMTMSCLVSYGLINFIAFIEAFIQNPSWRPTFRMPSYISLAGSLGCFSVMFMISPGAAFIVSFLVVALCFWTSSRNINPNWDDIRYSIFSYFVHKGTAKLSNLEKSAKNWRPHIFALFDAPHVQKNLAFFAHALNRERGFLTFGAGLKEHPKGLTAELKHHLTEFRIPSHVIVNAFSKPTIAADQMIKNYGFGNLKPNTILFSIPSKYEDEEFVRLILDTYHQKKNIVILKDDPNTDYIFSDPAKKKKQINLWWKGRQLGNFEFALALAFMLQRSKLWPQSSINIKTITDDEESKENLFNQFEKYRTRLRIKNLEFLPLLGSEADFFSSLANRSQGADLTFIGLRRPTETTTVEEYTKYYQKLLEDTRDVSNIAYVLSGESMKFRKIFT